MLNTEESVLLRAHPHPLIIIRQIGFAIILALLPLIISNLTSGSALKFFADHDVWRMSLFVWWVVSFGFIIISMRRWVANVAIVTNSHVVLSNDSLRSQTAWSLPVDKIETMRVTYLSRLHRIIKLGTIELKAGDQFMLLRHIYHPESVVNVITKVTAFLSSTLPEDQNAGLDRRDATEKHLNNDLESVPLITAEHIEQSLQTEANQSWTTPTAHQSVESAHLASNSENNELTEGEAVYF